MHTLRPPSAVSPHGRSGSDRRRINASTAAAVITKTPHGFLLAYICIDRAQSLYSPGVILRLEKSREHPEKKKTGAADFLRITRQPCTYVLRVAFLRCRRGNWTANDLPRLRLRAGRRVTRLRDFSHRRVLRSLKSCRPKRSALFR